MKRMISCFGYVIVAFICMNTAKQESDQPREKPRVNFHGTFKDTDNDQEIEVSNITIDGLYREIPVYIKPRSPESDPQKNPVYLDLDEILEIRSNKTSTATPETSTSKKTFDTFNGRKYMDIVVVLRNEKRTEKRYIVEPTRRLIFDEEQNGIAIAHRPEFQQLQMLKIGPRPTKREEPAAVEKSEKEKRDKQREYQCAQASNTLRTLEAESQKIPEPERSSMGSLIDSVKNWVGGICGTH